MPARPGKSTLLKLMLQQIEPTIGDVKRSGKLRIGHYNQHSEAVLDLDKTPLNFLKDSEVHVAQSLEHSFNDF